MLIKNTLSITKIVRSQRRTIALEINYHGEIIVRAPRTLSLKSIQAFISEKRDWLLKKQHLINTRPQSQPKQFLPGEAFLYLGQSYCLQIAENSQLTLHFSDTFILSAGCINIAEMLFTKWYKQQALTIISERVNVYAQLHNLQVKSVRLSNAQRRWGSCSNDGRLNFNWRLIMAPLSIIDYVVAHELAHLKHMNHSKAFWTYVASILPDYQTPRKWLHDNGYLLAM